MLLFQIDTLSSSSNIESAFSAINIIGWFGSSLVCIILTVVIYPFIENKFQSFIVKRLDFLMIDSGHKIGGKWTHKWHVESDNFPPINVIDNVNIKQFRSRIFAQYNVKDKNGKNYTYQMLGVVDKDQVITGVWKDVEKGNRYHGCFQIYIDINEQTMNGIWTGLSKEKHVKSGVWEWIRE